jgi:DNA-binding Lrp family transcriptional regulator
MSNESYINLFGKLCWINGYLAYQDSLGVVQTKAVNVTPTTSIIALEVGKHESRYEPLTSGESPSEILKVTGEIKKIRNLDNIPQTTTQSELFGTIILSDGESYTGIIAKTSETTDDVSASARTIDSHFASLKLPAEIMPGVLTYETFFIFSEIKDITKYYEKKPVVPSTYCFNPDEGRLIKSVETSQEPYRVVLKKYVEARLSYDPNK